MGHANPNMCVNCGRIIGYGDRLCDSCLHDNPMCDDGCKGRKFGKRCGCRCPTIDEASFKRAP